MPLTIHKFYFKPGPLPQKLTIPGIVTLLHVGEVYDDLYVWAMVDTVMIPFGSEPVAFYILGTGYEVTCLELQPFKFWKTIQMRSGLVWHIFVDKRFPIGYEGSAEIKTGEN